MNVKKKVNQHDEEGLSALHYAARYNHYPVVVMLINAGASRWQHTHTHTYRMRAHTDTHTHTHTHTHTLSPQKAARLNIGENTFIFYGKNPLRIPMSTVKWTFMMF